MLSELKQGKLRLRAPGYPNIDKSIPDRLFCSWSCDVKLKQRFSHPFRCSDVARRNYSSFFFEGKAGVGMFNDRLSGSLARSSSVFSIFDRVSSSSELTSADVRSLVGIGGRTEKRTWSAFLASKLGWFKVWDRSFSSCSECIVSWEGAGSVLPLTRIVPLLNTLPLTSSTLP